jgi:quinol monooxygenase YgiN
MINRIVRLSFQQEKVETFLLIFNQSKLKIANYPGCNGLKLLQDTSKKNVFYTYSVWDSEAALEDYRQSDLFKITWEQTKLLFNDKPVAYSTTILQHVK